MKEIYLVKQLNGTLIPAHDSDKELMSNIKAGEIYKYNFSKPRNVKFHRKFFALINLVYQNQDHYSFEDLREKLIKASGHYRIVIDIETGEEERKAKSIAFANMDEVEFSKLYNDVLNAIIKVFGWDGKDIEENVAEFM